MKITCITLPQYSLRGLSRCLKEKGIEADTSLSISLFFAVVGFFVDVVVLGFCFSGFFVVVCLVGWLVGWFVLVWAVFVGFCGFFGFLLWLSTLGST